LLLTKKWLYILENKLGLEHPQRNSVLLVNFTEKCSFTLFRHVLFTLTDLNFKLKKKLMTLKKKLKTIRGFLTALDLSIHAKKGP
jgi:hypothetical protein